jgi:hypothetical protein
VLVDHSTAEGGPQVQRLPGADQRVGEGAGLAAREAPEVHGHAPRSHLVVGHVASRVPEDEPGHLLVGEFAAVPLALDQLRGADHSSI